MHLRWKHILRGIPVLLVLVLSCEPQRSYEEDSAARLAFTTDTVFFDTVFTTIGTVTESFRIRNPHNKFVKIEEISLAGGDRSVFRINVDGVPGTRFKDVEIAPRDSMYVFVEATPDLNSSNDILRIQDSIVFLTNGNVQDVDLVAWGQDVHMITEGVIEGEETWLADKPYLIKDFLYVDTMALLRMEPGVTVHLHRDAIIYVDGSLQTEGSLEEPVRFLGDRLEEFYRDKPGQWGLIYLSENSRENRMAHTELIGGTLGVLISAPPESGKQPDLELKNCLINHMSSHGIYALNARIDAQNLVVGNCGGASSALIFGGHYTFNQCTYYNDWISFYGNRSLPALFLADYFITDDNNDGEFELITGGDFEQASFTNSIVYGNEPYELFIDSYDDRQLNYRFDHCLLKINTDSLDYENDPLFTNIINNEQPLLVAVPDTFALDTLSPAMNAGLVEHALLMPFDYEGISRLDDEAPDLGAYERVESGK